MAIQFIDNQPITWRTSWATDSDCKSPYDTACTLYSTNDYLFAQWKQTPCGLGTNQLCDPTFVNSNPELVSNGSFTSNSTGWTLGTGVTWDGTNKRIQFPGTTLTSALQQAITVANGTTYVVTFTIGGMTSGYITAKIDSVSGTPCYGAGTYSITITSAGTSGLYFDTHLFDGWIDDISVKKHELETTGGCWSGDANQWTINANGTITKTGPLTAMLYGTINNFSSGGYYKMTFRISNMTAGSIDLHPNSSITKTYTSDGVYTEYFTGDTSIFDFGASAAFNGTLSDLSVQLYANYYTVILRDTKNNTEADLSDSLELYDDYVTLKYQLGSVDPGCYELCVYDACGYNVNTDLITDYSFGNSAKWILDNTWVYNTSSIGSGKLTLTTTPSGSPAGTPTYNEWRIDINDTANYWPSAMTTMVIDWTIATGTMQANPNLYVRDKNGTYHLLVSAAVANTTYTGTLVLTGQQTVTGLSPQLGVYITSPGFSKVMEILDFRLLLKSYIPGQMTEYCSNCIEVIDYPDDEKCSLWVGGTNGADAFGFHFDPTSGTPFQIGARVRAMMINPKYKGDLKKYTSASGYNTVTQANSSKIYTLLIDYTDEHTHDWLRLATASDILRIGNFTNTTAKYVNTDGDYSPEWPDNIGNWPAAQARVEVSPLTDTLYNNNAG